MSVIKFFLVQLFRDHVLESVSNIFCDLLVHLGNHEVY